MSEARGVISRRSRIRASAVRVAILVAVLLAPALGRAQGSGVTPTSSWMDLYSDHSTFADLPVPVDAYVAVFDPQGTQCGEFLVTDAGAYGIMPCYGDDSFTPADEGPVAGERLTFKINGVACTAQPVSQNLGAASPAAIVTWSDQARLQVDLSLPARPSVTGKLQSGKVRLDWSAVAGVTKYEVWRSTAPYFAPGDADAALIKTVTAAPWTWSDGAGVGNVTLNYTYRIRSLNALTQTVGYSQAVADFDFALAH